MFSLKRQHHSVFHGLLFLLLLLSSPASYSYVNGSAAYCLVQAIEYEYPDLFPSRYTSQEASWSGDTAYIRSYNDNRYYGMLLVYRDVVYYSFYNQDWTYFSDFKTADDYFSAGYCTRTFVNSTASKPTPPASMSASALSSNSIKVSWTDNSNNETGFNLYKYVGGNWSKIATLSANVTSYTDTGLQPGTYYYAVEAYNSVGASWTTVSNGYVSVTLTASSSTNANSNTGTTGSSSSSTQTQGNYNVVSPNVDNSQVGWYTGTQKNDLYQIESGDFNNQLDIVVGGNDVIEFPSKLNVQQNIILDGVSMNAYNKNPSNVSGVLRNGNDLYFQYNTSTGSGSVTIKNYFTGSNAYNIQLIPMLGGTNYNAEPWQPIL